MGVRLTGFDYSRSYFYMVTIRCHAGVAALSRIVAPGKCELNEIVNDPKSAILRALGRAFARGVRRAVAPWAAV